MHPVNLIARAIKPDDPDRPEFPQELEQGICCLTGMETHCIKRGLLLGKSFTTGSVLQRPDSVLVSVDAFMSLQYKWERMSSWFCDGNEFTRLNRQGVRNMVFKKDMPPMWSAYATTSYKKHGSLLTPINTGSRRVWVFETRVVDMSDQAKVMEWWNVLNKALRSGIGRSIMEQLQCPCGYIPSLGLNTWIEFERWAKDKYLSALYSFLVYLLPSQDELKEESAGQPEPEPSPEPETRLVPESEPKKPGIWKQGELF